MQQAYTGPSKNIINGRVAIARENRDALPGDQQQLVNANLQVITEKFANIGEKGALELLLMISTWLNENEVPKCPSSSA